VRAHIDLYVNEYSRDLGPQGHAAVGYFLDQQRKLAAPLR
jgi:predicted solute-binding protein